MEKLAVSYPFVLNLGLKYIVVEALFGDDLSLFADLIFHIIGIKLPKFVFFVIKSILFINFEYDLLGRWL